MAPIIYGISAKGKRGIGYHKPENSLLKPKPTKNVKQQGTAHSQSTYGHSHYFYSTH